MWREEAYDQNGCMVAGEGRALGLWGRKYVWPESKGTETGMSQASSGGRDGISLPGSRVL